MDRNSVPARIDPPTTTERAGRAQAVSDGVLP